MFHSLESVLSGFSQHDEDKQADFSVERERHDFVQHDDKTLKRREENLIIHHHQRSSFTSIITTNVCVCVCVLFTLGSHIDTIKMIVNPSSDMNPLAKLEDRKKDRGEDERSFKLTSNVKVNI